MPERRPLFLDTTTGDLTEVGGPNTIDLAAMPWLQRVLADVAKCKRALQFMGVDPDEFDADISALTGGM